MENLFLLVKVKQSMYSYTSEPIAVSEAIGLLHAYTPGWTWELNCADIWTTNVITGDGWTTFYRIDTIVNLTTPAIKLPTPLPDVVYNMFHGITT